MPNSRGSMRRPGVAFSILVLAFFSALPAVGVVESFKTRIEIAADGSFTEHQVLTVRLDDPTQLDLWRVHAVGLDEHRQLISADAWRVDAKGRKKKLSRRERDEAEYSGEGVTFSSQRFLLFEPDLLDVGSRLIFDTKVAVKPYFPSGLMALQPNGEAVESLDIQIRSAAGTLQHFLPPHLGGEDSSLRVTDEADGRVLSVRGSLPEIFDPPAFAAPPPHLLRFAWGEQKAWSDIARWYSEIAGTVAHRGGAFDKMAAEVLGAGTTPIERLEAAVAAARRQIRYVAVEVGIGGYRPSPATETAERGWGDCKDKSLLLVEMLRHAGIDAYPALIRLDRERRIELDWPSPYDFNHLIAAVSVEGLDLAESAPISEGFLFVDPTQTTGGASYLHRGVQDQHALVITGGEGAGRLVRLPRMPHSEMVEITADIRPAEGGTDVALEMRYLGETASYLSRSLDAANPTDLEGAIRRSILGYFPGAEIHELVWDGRRDGLPAFEIQARLLLRVTEPAEVNMPAPDLFPSLADIEALEGHNAALSPAAARYRTRLHLANSSCRPRPRDSRVENGAGLFHYQVAMGKEAIEISFESILDRAWHSPGELPELRELAVAEHRASRRRLRLQCGE